jgi:hypothetical protein
VNRCGASVKDACRYPCETVRTCPITHLLARAPFHRLYIPSTPTPHSSLTASPTSHARPAPQVCEYKDTSLFSGFKSTGSASSSCDGAPEEPELPEEPEVEVSLF